MTTEKISFILPSYNTYHYTHLCYKSLRENLSPEHEILLMDDASTDESRRLIIDINGYDENVKMWLNNTGENIGISYVYNEAVKMASNEIICLLHSDMYVPPKFDEHIITALKHYDFVTTFRVEPPVYPESNDKIQMNFGLTYDEFKKDEFNKFCETNSTSEILKRTCFPWATTKTLYNRIAGNDELFLKYMVDDDDFYLRMKMSGATYAQIKHTYVYHFCSRSTKYAGDNFSKTGSVGWISQYQKSTRNFIRKWGFPQSKVYKEDMDIIESPIKYDIGLIITGTKNLDGILSNVEPFVSNVYTDNKELEKSYINLHQPTTIFNLADKFKQNASNINNDIVIEFNADNLSENDSSFIFLFSNLPDIITQTNEVGNFQYGIFSIKIKVMRRIENNLIKNVNNHTL